MAFVGKIVKEKAKKPDFQVTVNGTRIGLVFRNGRIEPGIPIDVLVGTEEDFGLLFVKFTPEGKAVKAVGKTGKTVSWSAVRGAAAILPKMQKNTDVTFWEEVEDGFLVNLNVSDKDRKAYEKSLKVKPTVAPRGKEKVVVEESADLGL